MVSKPNPQVGLAIPAEMPAGMYVVQARVGVAGRPDPSDTFLEVGFHGKNIESAIDVIACRRVRSPMRDPEIVKVEVEIPPLAKPLSVDVGEHTKKRVVLASPSFLCLTEPVARLSESSNPSAPDSESQATRLL